MENPRVEAAPFSTDGRRSGEARRSYTIGDLAREFGVSLRTLRFYEDRGLLKPQRAGASRLYDGASGPGSSSSSRASSSASRSPRFSASSSGLSAAKGAPKLRLSRKQIDDQIAHLERQKAEIEAAIAELKSQRQRIPFVLSSPPPGKNPVHPLPLQVEIVYM